MLSLVFYPQFLARFFCKFPFLLFCTRIPTTVSVLSSFFNNSTSTSNKFSLFILLIYQNFSHVELLFSFLALVSPLSAALPLKKTIYIPLHFAAQSYLVNPTTVVILQTIYYLFSEKKPLSSSIIVQSFYPHAKIILYTVYAICSLASFACGL